MGEKTPQEKDKWDMLRELLLAKFHLGKAMTFGLTYGSGSGEGSEYHTGYNNGLRDAIKAMKDIEDAQNAPVEK